MADIKFYSKFEHDTKKFINQINENLIKLENGGYSTELINDVFRCIHSIKSEAAYLNLDEIALAAHEMESAIEPLRNVGTEVEVDPALMEFCFSTIDKIGVLTIETKTADDGGGELEEISENGCGESSSEEEVCPYSNFEIMLINDARSRGEKLFSLSFRIADDENMKYPRAYLALSNLEQHINVIKVIPEVENIDKTADGRLSVYISTLKTEKAIAAEINIDQIINIEINELSYDEELKNFPVLKEEFVKPKEKVSARVISVEANEIDAISKYVSEIKKRLSDLSSAYSSGTADEKISYDLAGIETISNSIEKMMSNLQTVDFNVHFAGFKRTVRDLASKLEKKTELAFNNSNIRVPREFADFIAEPMLQIIRNAVVHGIELPSERVEAGKDETGIITISVEKKGLEIIITISDDGAGIKEEQIRSAYSSTEEDILDIIIKPGVTSINKSEQFAGRGVGLDLVLNRVKGRSGRLELTNKPGAGCEFRIVLSEKIVNNNYLVVESEGKACALSLEPNSDVIEIETADIISADGCCFYNNIQVFTINGRLREISQDMSAVKQAVKLSHLGKEGYLLFDEPLFEVSHNEDVCIVGDSISKYTKKYIVNGKEADYVMIVPDVVFD